VPGSPIPADLCADDVPLQIIEIPPGRCGASTWTASGSTTWPTTRAPSTCAPSR